MTTEPNTNLTSINFRLAPAQVRQLVLLSRIHGNRTRAVVVAIERLFASELATNPTFAEFVADAGKPAATPPAAEGDG
jgi:hypothetical protein